MTSLFTNWNTGLTANSMITKLENSLGVHPINIGKLFSGVTNGILGIIDNVAAWVFLLSELGIIVGALILAFGAVAHWAGVRRVAWRIIGFSFVGFLVGLFGPGLLLGVYYAAHKL